MPLNCQLVIIRRAIFVAMLFCFHGIYNNFVRIKIDKNAMYKRYYKFVLTYLLTKERISLWVGFCIMAEIHWFLVHSIGHGTHLDCAAMTFIISHNMNKVQIVED